VSPVARVEHIHIIHEKAQVLFWQQIRPRQERPPASRRRRG